MTIQTLPIESIKTDGNTQSRVAINQEVVAEYARLLTDEVKLPPITVFHDGSAYWLADGFHRLFAALSLKSLSVSAMVYQGTQRDAILYSLNANTHHGLSPSAADKRRAVNIMLDDPEWSILSHRAIALHCGVSSFLVNTMVKERTDAKSGLSKPSAPKPPKSSGGQGTPTGNTVGQGESSLTTKPNVSGSSGTSSTPPTDPGTPATPPDANATPTAEQIAQDAFGDVDPVALLEEISELRDLLAAAEADDAKAEVIKYKRIADISNRRQNELMDTVNQRERELQRQANILRRIGKAMNEDDTSKLAALVEAMARSAKVAA